MEVKKLFDKIVIAYVLITVLFYVLCSLAPIVSMIKYTPLYSYQRYLGILGVGLIILDVIINKNFYKKNHIIFLYVMIVSASIASFKTWEYGFKKNLFSIAWMMIMIYLFYNVFNRNVSLDVKSVGKKMYFIITIIWSLAIFFSLFSVVFDEGYSIITNPYEPTAVTRQGFFENRLFGVFMSINVAAIISGILLIISIYMFIKESKIVLKLVCLLNIVLNILYVILSGSRSSCLGLFIASLVFVLYYIYIYFKSLKKNIYIKVGCLIIVVFCIVTCLIFAVSLVKNVIQIIPLDETYRENTIKSKQIIRESSNTERNTLEIKSDKKKVMNERLQRQDIDKENISNNRFKIWGDYLSLYKEIGLVGLSPCNYSYRIMESNPDIYIVEHIRNNYPTWYSTGAIYHPHNAYLGVYVGSGIIGLCALFCFFVFCLKDVVGYYADKSKPLSSISMGVLIIIYCLCTGMFDQELFFINDILTCVFWLTIGYVMYEIESNKKFQEK